MRLHAAAFALTTASVFLVPWSRVNALHAAPIVDLGLADQFTLSQPIVQVQVADGATVFDISPLNECLLDTGASGIFMGGAASRDLRAAGLETVATYVDFGVAGPQSSGVSKPYTVSYAGTDGVPLTLSDTRIQTSNSDFAFYAGIAGMPLMMNRTVGLDLSKQADMTALRMEVAFSGEAPATRPHQYSVPLSMYEFPMTGRQHPDDPLPVYAPLPFAPVRLQAGRTRIDGSFLLDTGAQQCILSSDFAFSLGLDANGNGDLADEAVSFQTVAGVGGSVTIPVLSLDALSLRTAEGVDLMFRDVPVGIIDIDEAVPGVLGMNMLNGGWEIHSLNTFLGIDPGPPGVFGRVDLDFRAAAATMQAEMRLTMRADADVLVSQGPITIDAQAGSVSQSQAGHAAIGGDGSLVKTGLGTLVLDRVNTFTGTTSVQAGTLRIAEPKALFASPTVVEAGGTLAVDAEGATRLPGLVVAGGAVELADAIHQTLRTAAIDVQEGLGGRIDLGAGRIEIAAGGTTEAAMRADIVAARAGGSWDGPGIGSSAAGAGSGRGIGYRVLADGSSVAAFAAFGDMNLDGVVNTQDLNLLLQEGRFGTTATDAGWVHGDFNYDGRVNTQDLNLLLAAGLYGQAGYLPPATVEGGLATAAFGELSSLSTSTFTASAVSVPEPSGMLLVGVGLSAITWIVTSCGAATPCRRRRRPPGPPSRSSRARAPQ